MVPANRGGGGQSQIHVLCHDHDNCHLGCWKKWSFLRKQPPNDGTCCYCEENVRLEVRNEAYFVVGLCEKGVLNRGCVVLLFVFF